MIDLIKRHPTLGKTGWKTQLKKWHSNCLNTEIRRIKDEKKHALKK